jgi:NhaA family Na+:H+ antiporter
MCRFAGVVIGLITPARPVRGRHVLQELEHRLHPISTLAVVPVFALANAGVYFGGGLITDALGSRLTWAVAAGLVVGKLLGIGGVTHIALRGGWARLPADMHAREVWGIAALCGIGFTVSLFVTDLALSDPILTGRAKVGLFAGSAISVLLGAGLLLVARVRAHVGRVAAPKAG